MLVPWALTPWMPLVQLLMEADCPTTPARCVPRAPGRILLIGMMGSGKTTVGQLLADHLGWSWYDLDALVELRSGQSIVELFAAGEDVFRSYESQALEELLGEPAARRPGDDLSVVSLGGGVVLDRHNRQLLRCSGSVVWLRAAVRTLVERVGAQGAGRPLLRAGAGAALEELARQRGPLYGEVAHVVVDVDGLGVEQVVARVLECLGPQRPRDGWR